MEDFSYWLLAGLILGAGAAWLAHKSFKRRENKGAVTAQPSHRINSDEKDSELTDQPPTQPSAAPLQSEDRDDLYTQRLIQEEAAQIAAKKTAADLEADKLAAQAEAEAEAQALAQAEAAKQAAAAAEIQRQAFKRAQQQAALEAAHKQAIEEAAAQELSRLEIQRNQAQISIPKTPQQTVIMIADDSKLVRIKTGRLLTQFDYQVLYALDGQDAALQMQTTVPDILITDVEMPGMDGFALSAHVRNTPATAKLPIIMITAADEKHRLEADRVGVSILMGKPYSDENLINHIRLFMHSTDALSSVE
jgi:CheY-like chemotaxis protein